MTALRKVRLRAGRAPINERVLATRHFDEFPTPCRYRRVTDPAVHRSTNS